MMDKNDKPADVKPADQDNPAETVSEHKSSGESVSEKKSSNKTLIIILSVVGGLIVLGVVSAIVVPMLIAGAFFGATNAALKSAGVDVSTNGGNTTITTKDGSVSTSAKLSDDFPSTVPLYSGQTIVSNSRVKSGEDISWSVTAESNDSTAKVASGLKSQYSSWTSSADSESDGSYTIYYTKGDLSVNLYVTSSNGKTTITYYVTKMAQTQ